MSDATLTATPPTSPDASARNTETTTNRATWIAGRVQTLLSHYFQPDAPAEINEAAIRDWVRDLVDFPQAAIDHACAGYRRDQPRRRPTPGDIRHRAKAYLDARTQPRTTAEGDRSRLSHDERTLLDQTVLPTARRWVEEFPNLAVAGARTLAYWGAHVSLDEAIRLREDWNIVLPADLCANPPAYRAWLNRNRNATQPDMEGLHAG